MALAIDLALQDMKTIVVERHDAIQQVPKGQNLTARTGEHFRRWGVTDAIRAASPIPRSYGSGGAAAVRAHVQTRGHGRIRVRACRHAAVTLVTVFCLIKLLI